MEAETSAAPSGAARFVIIVLLLTTVLIAAGAYSLHERSAVQRLSTQNDRVTAALQETHSQIDALKAQVAALSAPPRRAARVRAAARVKAAKPAATPRRTGDPRWQKLQAQLDEQGRQIESTRQNLADTRTELQGSIAKTHDELVVLQKQGERNYYEFDLDKAKQFHREGPVGIRVRKANTKHQYADLELMVDDVSLSKKHVNLLEPVFFYVAEGGRPVELVINSITKNHIHGYVSAPKYKASELAAAAPDNSAAAAGATAGQNGAPVSPQTRRRLELPK